jgi:hypothetical protein
MTGSLDVVPSADARLVSWNDCLHHVVRCALVTEPNTVPRPNQIDKRLRRFSLMKFARPARSAGK